MTFTDTEKALARSLCENPDMLAFLEKVFCPEREAVERELEKNVAALDDAEYGRLMKVTFLMRASFSTKLNLIRQMGGALSTPTTQRRHAPL